VKVEQANAREKALPISSQNRKEDNEEPVASERGRKLSLGQNECELHYDKRETDDTTGSDRVFVVVALESATCRTGNSVCIS